MARRRSFALEGAVMVLTAAVAMLAVSTYIFFSKAKETEQGLRQTQQELVLRQMEAEEAIAAHDQLRETIGHPPHTSLDAIDAAHEADVRRVMGATEARPAYRIIISRLAMSLGEVAAREVNVRLELQRIVTDLSRQRGEFEAQLHHHRELEDQLAAELHQQREIFNADRQRVVEQMEVHAEKATDRGRQIVLLEEELASLARDFTRQLDVVQRRYEVIREKWESVTRPSFERPDGRIVSVSRRGDEVVIDLGTADRLPALLAFGVFEPGGFRYRQVEAKAMIEVVQVDRPQMAVARIVEESLADPILPGDVIYTSLWEPGAQRRFALAGAFDVDDDGREDGRFVRDVISLADGLVDAEVDAEGNRVGALSIDTRFVIVGDPPASAAGIEEYSRLLAEADRLGIDRLSVSRLLDLAGLRRPLRVTHLDGAGR